MTLIDILDSSVKIGLGAAITAIATYINSSASHARELSKEASQAKRKSLEEIADLTEDFTKAVLGYWAMITEWSNKERKGENLLPERQIKLDSAISELWPAYQSLTVAEARLLLLGEDSAQKSCRDYGELMTQFRQKAWPGGRPLENEQLQEWRLKLLTARTSFYKILSSRYQVPKK